MDSPQHDPLQTLLPARRMFNEEHPLEILVDSASEERYSKLVLRDNTDGSIQVGTLSGCVRTYVRMLRRLFFVC